MDNQASFLTGQWPALAAGSEQRWKALSAANARLMRGMLSIWQHELELGQQLMAENLADPKAFSEAVAGGAGVGAQWSAAHQRFEHTVAAMRKINDEFFDCLFDVAAMANGAPEEGPEEGNRSIAPAGPLAETRASVRAS
jgi:hypothetical protein